MKNLFITILLIFCVLTYSTNVFAQTTTTTPSPSGTSITPTPTDKPVDVNLLNQINNLKEKIASKVAQLNLVEKRGIAGTVTDATSTQITLNDIQNNTQFVDVDEITKFSETGKDSIGISDLTKGTKISVLGLYNKDSRRLLARFVNVVSFPVYMSGIIASIDKPNRQFMLATEDGKQTKIDVENITKITSFTQASDLTKIAFSKLQVGDTTAIMGYPDTTTPSMILANRIVQLPEVSKDPKISVNIPTLQPSISITPSPTAGASATKNNSGY